MRSTIHALTAGRGDLMLVPAPTKNVRALLKDEEGATAVEYGLIVAAIASVIIGVVFATGKKINNTFNNVQSRL